MVDSLREYILVEQDSPQVDVYYKNSQGVWEYQTVTDLQASVSLKSIGIELPMKEIYRDINFG